MYVNLLNIGKQRSTSSAKSESGVDNSQVGVCPKCKKSMSNASISSGESVFYCESCRVAVPRPNN